VDASRIVTPASEDMVGSNPTLPTSLPKRVAPLAKPPLSLGIISWRREMHNYTKIPNFENYLINREGSIFSTKVNRELTPQINSRGYKFIRLHENGKQFSFLLHRLLAYVFLDLPSLSSALEVDHIDSDILNNSLSNLQVLTHKQHHFKTHGPYSETLEKFCTCGAKLSEFNTSGLCRKHWDESRINDGITAEQIVYWVGNYSWTRASKELNLSDTGLRKRYRKLTGLDPKSLKKLFLSGGIGKHT